MRNVLIDLRPSNRCYLENSISRYQTDVASYLVRGRTARDTVGYSMQPIVTTPALNWHAPETSVFAHL
ncbi:unnamed protein product [Pieris brassicae]|uniref:Uncharacterized protein n=1 Tax=Pieris brassicae TaxID=7116 RepID=A0A9P0T090_PIEBR|nr:unnamed protein product [Pieris brassicae]